MRDPGRNLTGFLVAIVLHGGIAVALALSPPPRQHVVTVVEVDIRQPPPPQPPIPMPTPEPPKPEPERKIAKQPRPAEAPRPTQTRQQAKPTPPVFGISPSETAAEGGMSVATGNTTMADPSKRPKVDVAPLPPSSAPAGKEYHPVTEDALRSLPEWDMEACVSGLRKKYTGSDAAAAGVEGEVVFRVELDEQGNKHGIKIIKRVGHGLDEMALGWLRFSPQCRMRPAIAKDGKPVAYVIESVKFTFELDR